MEKLKQIQAQINKVYQYKVIRNEIMKYYDYLAISIEDNEGKIKSIALYSDYNLVKIFLKGNNILYFEKISSVMDYLKCNLIGE